MPGDQATESSSDGWRGKGLLRILLLLGVAAALAAIAGRSALRATTATCVHRSCRAPGGQYHAIATRLAERANRERGGLTVVATAGSIENVVRLKAGQARCNEMFALIQDGTPVSADARFELLGRLPQPESLLLLAKAGRNFRVLADLRGASIGIGPAGSGTAHLMQQLFADRDLRDLDIKLSPHALTEQAELVAQGKLDVAAMVMQEDAELLRKLIRDHGLDIVSHRTTCRASSRASPGWVSGASRRGFTIWCAILRDRQASRAAEYPGYRKSLRAARRSHRAADADGRRAPGVCARQSSGLNQQHDGAPARARSASVLSQPASRSSPIATFRGS